MISSQMKKAKVKKTILNLSKVGFIFYVGFTMISRKLVTGQAVEPKTEKRLLDSEKNNHY